MIKIAALWIGVCLLLLVIIPATAAVVWENQRTSCWVKGGSLSFYGTCRMSVYDKEKHDYVRWVEAP